RLRVPLTGRAALQPRPGHPPEWSGNDRGYNGRWVGQRAHLATVERAGMTDSVHDPAPDGLTGPPSRDPAVRVGASSAAYVDYEFAKGTGRTVVKAGPQVTSDEVDEIVADLRAAAAEAEEPVAQTSRLRAPDGAPPPLIVDRAGWI